jgi:hypothetical protein
VDSSPPDAQPRTASDREQGQTQNKSTRSSRLVLAKHFVILWAAVFLVESVAARIGFEKPLVGLDQAITRSLEHLDPFALAHDFYGRWSDPHSLRVWSFSAPFNARVHDGRILAQMRALRKQAPEPPADPRVAAQRSMMNALALGEIGIGNLPAPDPAAEESANAQYERSCQEYLADFNTWEQPYHQLALGLTNFDSSAYAEHMNASCGSETGAGLSGPHLSFGPRYYDQSYFPAFPNAADLEGHGALQSLWQDVLGLPDALIFTVGSAFAHGLFQATLAVFLIVLTFGVLAKKMPILIPILPLFAGCFGWFLLEMVRGAHLLLHSLLPAPGIPTVATAALWPVSGFIDSLFSIAKDDVAHKIAKEVERIRV